MNKGSNSKIDPNKISERFIDQLYSLQFSFVDEKGAKLDIPESGFLGLLATGYKGLVMLRKKRGRTHLYQKFTKGKKLIRRNPRKQNNPPEVKK